MSEPSSPSKRKRSRKSTPMKLTIKLTSPEKKKKNEEKEPGDLEMDYEDEDEDEDDDEFDTPTCDFCLKTFDDRGKLVSHIRRVHRSSSHCCVCHGKEFKTRKSMLRHEEKTQEGTMGQRKNYRKYSHDDLLNAYTAVKEKQMPIREAARKYGIPFTTLLDRTAGRAQMKSCSTSSGPPPLISREDEKKLCLHVQFMAAIGYTYLRSSVTQLASELAIYKGVLGEGKTLSDNWYRKFASRWPDMLKRKSTGDSSGSWSPDVVKKYFEEYTRILKTHSLEAKPQNIYCMTVYEMNIHKLGASPKKKGTSLGKGSDLVSIILCCNAAGTSMAPFLVFSGSSYNDDLLQGCLPNTQARSSLTGEVDSSIFKDYFKNHLLKLLKTGETTDEPVVVMYNGHLMHFEVERIEWARKHGVMLFALPPQTYHLKSSLDSEMKDLFQQFFKQEAKKYSKRHGGDQVTRHDVSSVLSKVFPQVFTSRIVVRFFKNAGIYPINPSVVEPRVTTESVKSFNEAVFDDLESTDAFLEVRLPFPNAANHVLQRRNEIPLNSLAGKKQKQLKHNQGSPRKPQLKAELKNKDDSSWSSNSYGAAIFEHSYVHGIGNQDTSGESHELSVKPVISMANTAVENESQVSTVVLDNDSVTNVVESSVQTSTVLDNNSVGVTSGLAQEAPSGHVEDTTGEAVSVETVPVVETQVVSSVVEVGTSEEPGMIFELGAEESVQTETTEVKAIKVTDLTTIEESNGQKVAYAHDPETNTHYKIIISE